MRSNERGVPLQLPTAATGVKRTTHHEPAPKNSDKVERNLAQGCSTATSHRLLWVRTLNQWGVLVHAHVHNLTIQRNILGYWEQSESETNYSQCFLLVVMTVTEAQRPPAPRGLGGRG